MTSRAALALALALGAAGAVADTLMGQVVRTLFTVGFSAGCLAAVLLVRRERVVHTMVRLPLVYLVLLVVGAAVSGRRDALTWLATAYVFKAPAVLIGTALGAVAGGVRLRATR